MIDFSEYIVNYGKEVGLSDLKLNEDGICSLSFDEKLNVDIVYRKEQEQVIFAAPIGDIPAEGQEGFFKQLLIANAFGIENAGAVLGIEEDENRVVLSYMFISSTFSFDLFKTVLANFVDLVEVWQEKIKTIESESSSFSSEGYSAPMDSFEFTRV
ncbi:MAG: type III secretion system chaperone [Opitutales bacterium]